MKVHKLKTEIHEPKRNIQEELEKLCSRVAELESWKDEKHQREISALVKSSRAILTSGDFKSTARLIFDFCKEMTGAQSGYVALLSKDGLENEVLFLDAGGMPCSVNPNLPMPIRGLRERAYKTGKVVFDNDFMKSEWMKYMPKGHVSLQNVMFAPLKIDGTCVGIMGIANKPDDFNESDARLASAFGELAAIALQKSHTEHLLDASEERFHSLVQSATDAVVSVDCSGNITFWNPSAETMFGYSEKEVMGRPLAFLMPERFQGAHEAAFQKAAMGKKLSKARTMVQITGVKKNGAEFPIELTLSTWNARGETFFSAILRDISQRKIAEEELNTYRGNLETLVKERTEELTRINRQMEEEITLKEQAENELQLFNTLINHSHDSIGVINPATGRLLNINDKMCSSLGYTREEMLFLTVPDIEENLNDMTAWEEHVAEVEKKGSMIFDGIHVRKDRTTFPVEVNVRYASVKGKSYMVAIARDVTERKKTENALCKAKEKAEEATKLKDKFVSLVAHDLRSPITNFNSVLRLVSEDTLPLDKKKDIIEIGEQTINRMVTLIDEILSISRLKTGKVKIKLSNIDAHFMAEKGVLDFGAQAGQKGIKLINRVPYKSIVRADETLFYEVLRNLLSNAVKFSASGDIIAIFIPNSEPSTIAVSDTGTGIPAELMENLFDYETKTSTKGTGGEKGTGFGLPLARDIMSAHGGTLTLESAEGEGTTFYAKLPT